MRDVMLNAAKHFISVENVNHGRLIKSLISLDWCSEIKSHFPAHTPRIFRGVCALAFLPHFLTSAGRQRNINFRVADSSAHAEALPYLISGLILFILANYSWGGDGSGATTTTTTQNTHDANTNSLTMHFLSWAKNKVFIRAPPNRVCIPTGRAAKQSFCNWRRAAAADVGPNYFHPLISGESV